MRVVSSSDYMRELDYFIKLLIISKQKVELVTTSIIMAYIVLHMHCTLYICARSSSFACSTDLYPIEFMGSTLEHISSS